MKLYYEIIKLLYRKYIRRCNTGEVIKDFCEKMGIVYIKFAQILATQNFGSLFTEEDRKMLSSICDDCMSIPFEQIREIIEKEYNLPIEEIFSYIDPKPIGAASISQVHKAILKNGDVIALKIKRRDITDHIEDDINMIKKLMYRYGKIIKFGNFSGGDKALDIYFKWILEETDFSHEKQNIRRYSDFANSVNVKIEGNKEIKVPRLYEELCTETIIAMEFIEHKTLNQLELTEDNCDKIKTALNSYISSSLYAMFNGLPIVFHGDPHNGNIYIDESGNIGFLDMGLLFELSEEDAKLTKDFFFAAYTRNYEKMYNLVIRYGKMDEKTKIKFKMDVKEYCDSLISKPLTSYFVDMMNICLKYEVCPPNFLFCMAKAFMCLGGINNLSKNDVSGNELLKTQVIEYYIRENLVATKNIVIKSIKLMPRFLESTSRYGLVKGISKEIAGNDDLKNQIKDALIRYREILDIVLPTIQDSVPLDYDDDTYQRKRKL